MSFVDFIIAQPTSKIELKICQVEEQCRGIWTLDLLETVEDSKTALR